MKKLISVLFVLLIIFSASACEKDSSNIDLMSILKNEQKFIAENGEEVYLKDYKYAEEYYATPSRYALVDFDGDGINELVVDISLNGGIYLVFHNDGSNIYGFQFFSKELQNIKVDGSFSQSGAAVSNYYTRITFDGDDYEITNVAVCDEYISKYEIDGKECSIEEIDEYIENWQQKEDVNWIEYEKRGL